MNFEHFNQRKKILGVAKAWRAQYQDRKGDIAAKLDALDLNTASSAEVAAIIGNESWTSLFCSSCNEYGAEGIGFQSDGTVWVCGNCLRGAVAVLNSHRR